MPPYSDPGRTSKDYLKSGWVNGLEEDTIATGKTATGLPVAAADAQTEGWHFRIKIIQIGNQVYRFITAAPAGNQSIVAVSDAITDTFRQLDGSRTQGLGAAQDCASSRWPTVRVSAISPRR